MLHTPFYDPLLTYEENYEEGPFGAFADEKVFKQTGQPQYEFLGQKVFLPFGIPAGPLLNSNFCKAAFEKGFDVCVYKTQRSTKFPVNTFPNILYLDIDGDLTLEKAAKPQIGRGSTEKDFTEISITNSFGNPCRGPEVWQTDIKRAVSFAKKGQLVVASVVGTIQEGFSDDDYYNDFAESAKIAAGTGVKAIEVNLSCPNVANEGVLCYTPSAVVSICRKTKDAIGNIPLIAKVGYYSDSQNELLENIIEQITPFVSAVAAINTIAAPVVDESGNQALPGPNRLKSGICGAGVKWAGMDMVKKLKNIREKLEKDFEIIGIGGVMTSDDYFKYKKIGADSVMSATGAMWNPMLAEEIKNRIASAFEKINTASV